MPNKGLSQDQPFHQPSKSATFTDASADPFPYKKWSSKQQAIVAQELVSFRSSSSSFSSMSSSKKYESIVTTWCARALDPNDNEFQLSAVPSPQEVETFSEYLGQKAMKETVDVMVNASSLKRKRETTVKQEKQTFHSDDAKQNQKDQYLIFPVTSAHMTATYTNSQHKVVAYMSQRRLKAYCRVFNIKGRRSKLKAILNALVTNIDARSDDESNLVATIEAVDGTKPAAPPDSSKDWSTWSVDV